MLRAHTLIGAFVVSFACFLIVLLPAKLLISMAFPPGVISYGGVEGSIWRVTLSDTRVRGVDLGILTAKPGVAALVFGGFSGPVSFSHPMRHGKADVSVTETVTLSGVEFVSDYTFTLSGQRVTGALSGRGGTLEFGSYGRCIAANVPVRTNLLSGIFQQFGLQAPVLAGSIACQNGAPTLALDGENAVFTFSAEGRFQTANRLHLAYELKPAAPGTLPDSLQSTLESAGLTQRDAAWVGTLVLEL